MLSKADRESKRAKAAARKERREQKRLDTLALASLTDNAVAVPLGESGEVGPLPRPEVFRPLKRQRRAISPLRTTKRRLPKRSTLKSQIIRLLGLLDRKKHGDECRLGVECPTKTPHSGEVAYHVIPAQRGDSTRFVPENVVWACAAANYGECRNRSLYRDKHCRLFGAAMVEALEAQAREKKHYTRTELYELRERLRAEVEGTSSSVSGSRPSASPLEPGTPPGASCANS